MMTFDAVIWLAYQRFLLGSAGSVSVPILPRLNRSNYDHEVNNFLTAQLYDQ
jgi:hypothetical protein